MRHAVVVASLLTLGGCAWTRPATVAPHSEDEAFIATGRTISFASERTPTHIKRDLSLDEVSGFYSRTFDLTHGVRIYLFPDQNHFVVLFCDICTPEVFSRGRWSLEDGRVSLSEVFRDHSPDIPVWHDVANIAWFQIATTLKNAAPDIRLLVPLKHWQTSPVKARLDLFQTWIREPLQDDWHESANWLRELSLTEEQYTPVNYLPGSYP